MKKINLYVTADKIDTPFGGGPTIAPELKAFRSLGPCEIINPPEAPPFEQDEWAFNEYMEKYRGKVELVHSYSGTWTRLVRQLREDGVRYTSTCCAHDTNISQREHKNLGIDFPYEHLTNPGFFHTYTEHLRLAEWVISPSTYSKSVLDKQGISHVKLVPHGFDGPKKIKPMPKSLVFGYLGSAGSDKGLGYLLTAWHNLKPKAQLWLAGKCCPWAEEIIKKFDIKNVVLKGELKSTEDFYNSISCYIAPSTTEGFHLPVLEAMAYGRSVLCSKNAGAADIAPVTFEGCNVEALMKAIKNFKPQKNNHKIAQKYTTAKQIEAYKKVWKEVRELPSFVGDHQQLKVNMGSFVNMFYHGWVNVDILGIHDYAFRGGYKFVQADVKNPLPFSNETVDLMFSHHMLEHITWEEAVKFIVECKRVMKPKGVIRIVVPSLEGLVKVYQNRDMDRYIDNEGVANCPVQSGKFWALLTAGHFMCYDFDAFKTLGELGGFKVKQCKYRQGHPQIINETWENLPDSLFVEMEKI